VACALYLLHASPHLTVDDVTFSDGDGLLALALLVPLRQELFQRGLPYPLPLLMIDESPLIAHAIRRDLRAAAWADRELRQMIVASLALFPERPEGEPAEAAGDAGGWPALLPAGQAADGAAWAGAWTAAISGGLENLERDMIAEWREIRAHWAGAVEIVDLSEPLDEVPPDLAWAYLKTLLVVAFDHVLLGKRDWGEKLPLLAEEFDDARENVLPSLDPLDPFGLAGLAGDDDPAGETSVELNEDERQLLAAMGEADRRLLARCRDLAKRYYVAALLAGWGAIVLRRLREQTANPDLGAGYDGRAAPYLWLAEKMSPEPALSSAAGRPTGEKLSPLASLNAPQP
jgi:hypothetical protein